MNSFNEFFQKTNQKKLSEKEIIAFKRAKALSNTDFYVDRMYEYMLNLTGLTASDENRQFFDTVLNESFKSIEFNKNETFYPKFAENMQKIMYIWRPL